MERASAKDKNTIEVLQGLLAEKTAAFNRFKAMTKTFIDGVKDF